jgi:ADP-ribose pyrophosphatase YjhB (NUDIX family)
MDEALARELREEVNVELVGPAVLFGAYLNITVSPRDHVMFYLAREFSVSGPKRPNLEIAAAQWFPIADPPPGTTTATRRRLREITGHKPVVPKW